ncbi:MAG: hypothetical protein JWM11_7175 [Planctomycetaceae bacterium]|nr:hypothetical protein [Planctomycetaceae bacterium]
MAKISQSDRTAYEVLTAHDLRRADVAINYYQVTTPNLNNLQGGERVSVAARHRDSVNATLSRATFQAGDKTCSPEVKTRSLTRSR